MSYDRLRDVSVAVGSLARVARGDLGPDCWDSRPMADEMRRASQGMCLDAARRTWFCEFLFRSPCGWRALSRTEPNDPLVRLAATIAHRQSGLSVAPVPPPSVAPYSTFTLAPASPGPVCLPRCDDRRHHPASRDRAEGPDPLQGALAAWHPAHSLMCLHFAAASIDSRTHRGGIHVWFHPNTGITPSAAAQ